MQNGGQQTFSGKGRKSPFSFAGHMFSVTTTQLCCWREKTAVDDTETSECGWGASKTTFVQTGSGGIRPADGSVLTAPPHTAPLPDTPIRTHLWSCSSLFLPPLKDLQVPEPGVLRSLCLIFVAPSDEMFSTS